MHQRHYTQLFWNVDSVVDLLSQAVLATAARYMKKYNYEYPVGRSKLESLSVLACSGIMFVTSVEVIQFSAQDLINGFSKNRIRDIDMSTESISLVAAGIFLKLVLFLFCRIAVSIKASDQLQALSEDHINDVFSNTGALISAAIAADIHLMWWLDPVSAIAISLIIMYRWGSLIAEQMRKIIGHTAPPEFINELTELTNKHDSRIVTDNIRAYHFGSRYYVEIEAVFPPNMTVSESHDIALTLQRKVEEISDVERAFVHVDYQKRSDLEHKIWYSVSV
jgi:cation diffusion facilitator family transporter